MPRGKRINPSSHASFEARRKEYLSRFGVAERPASSAGKCRAVQVRGEEQVFRSARAIAEAHGIGLSTVLKSLRRGEPAMNGKTYIYAKEPVTCG